MYTAQLAQKEERISSKLFIVVIEKWTLRNKCEVKWAKFYNILIVIWEDHFN